MIARRTAALLLSTLAAATASTATATAAATPAFQGPGSAFTSLVPATVALAGDRITVTNGADKATKLVPVNPTVGRELAAFAKRPDGSSNTWINAKDYTAPITRVPANAPLQPVKLCRLANQCVPSWATALDRAMRGVARDGVTSVGGGIPVPANFTPRRDSDGAAIIYQPDYVAPDGKRGRVWELWQLKENPTFDKTKPVSPSNPRWQASWGGRMVGTQQGQGTGYWTDCWWAGCGYQADTKADPDAWGRPDSQARQKAWGSTATSLALLGTIVSKQECRAGKISHAIGIEVPDAHPGAWWPAQRGDGGNPALAITEGMRLTLPRGVKKPKGLSHVASTLFDVARRHGLIVDDKTASSLNFRVEPGCEQTAWFGKGKVPTWSQMDRFPWSKLRVVARGTPAQPFPTR